MLNPEKHESLLLKVNIDLTEFCKATLLTYILSQAASGCIFSVFFGGIKWGEAWFDTEAHCGQGVTGNNSLHNNDELHHLRAHLVCSQAATSLKLKVRVPYRLLILTASIDLKYAPIAHWNSVSHLTYFSLSPQMTGISPRRRPLNPHCSLRSERMWDIQCKLGEWVEARCCSSGEWPSLPCFCKLIIII